MTTHDYVRRARSFEGGSDLDCDGVPSRFELHARRAADRFTREPLLRVVDELE